MTQDIHSTGDVQVGARSPLASAQPAGHLIKYIIYSIDNTDKAENDTVMLFSGADRIMHSMNNRTKI